MARKQLRFDDFEPAAEISSRTKTKVRSRDTRAELILRKELWSRELRYRLHLDSLPGRPDIVFTRKKVAIFVDGDFWHGRDWPARKKKLLKGSNSAYWIAKIESNIERDRRKNRQLEASGWTVLRFWETDVLLDVGGIADQIEDCLNCER